MNYQKMTVESLANYCFIQSGYAINKQDLISRINHLINKERAEQLRLNVVGVTFTEKRERDFGRLNNN